MANIRIKIVNIVRKTTFTMYIFQNSTIMKCEERIFPLFWYLHTFRTYIKSYHIFFFFEVGSINCPFQRNFSFLRDSCTSLDVSTQWNSFSGPFEQCENVLYEQWFTVSPHLQILSRVEDIRWRTSKGFFRIFSPSKTLQCRKFVCN